MTESSEKNGDGAALAKLLNQLNLPTLAAIAIFGGGNWFATKSTSDEQRLEILQAVRQIHDLHNSLNDFEERQMEALKKGTAIISTQNDLLHNQSLMLDNQNKMLQELKGKP